jgi:hypothetical protein
MDLIKGETPPCLRFYFLITAIQVLMGAAQATAICRAATADPEAETTAAEGRTREMAS